MLTSVCWMRQTTSVKTNLALVAQESLILKSHGRTMSLPISMRVSLLISLRQESSSPLLVKSRLEERIKSFSPFLSEDILNGKTYIRELSAGNKQKVGIATALLHCPKFVILDEPFNFLDPSSQNQLKDLLSMYRQQHQASILISSHNLHHTTDISDRIVLMEKGAIVKDIDKINETTIKELENYFL